MTIQKMVCASLMVAASVAGAQGQVSIAAPRAASGGRAILMPSIAGIDAPRAVIGVTTQAATGARDTLGLLVSGITRNSPAEKAGIEEGNRIAAINGVSLRIAASDLDDPDMQNLMTRRLTRELDKVKPGDEVDLKVFGGGQQRPLKIRTVSPDSLYSNNVYRRKVIDDRPTLGLGIGSSGSKRDTLGVFIMSVEDGGPAAKAGIEEGQRISAINGVDLRVSRDDAGDDMVSSAKVNRLERELGKVKVGDAVDLKVVANGQTRTVKVTTIPSSDLRSHSITIIRDGGDYGFSGDNIAVSVRRAVEDAQKVAGERIEAVGGALGNFGRGLNGGNIRWESNVPARPMPKRTLIWM